MSPNSVDRPRGCARQYWCGACTCAPGCAAACRGQRGSYRMPRAKATRSARPCAHRVEHLGRETHAVLQCAAAGVVALVGQRRQELVQRAAVRGVQLDRVQPQALRRHGAVGEGLAHTLQTRGVEGPRRHFVWRLGQRRGSVGDPPAGRVGSHLLAAVPGRLARTLAPGMRELDRDRHGRMPAQRAQHTRQRRLGGTVVQAQVAGGDAAAGLHRSGLGEQRAGARQCQLPEVDQVPVGGLAVLGRVLAHGGSHDPVGQRKPTQLARGEELAHGGGFRVAASRAAGRSRAARFRTAPNGRSLRW